MYTFPLASQTDVRARKSGSDHIHVVSPACCVKGLYVIVDMHLGEEPIGNPLSQHLSAIWINLHSTNRRMTQEQSSQNPSTSPSKQMHFPHVTLQ
jgi:hypothetical protein